LDSEENLCSWDFFLLINTAPTYKAASVCQFFTPKMLQPLISPPPPVLTRFIPTRLFSVPQVKRTPLYGCCWDTRSHNWWIEECPKRLIFGSFSETVWSCKPSIYASGALFWI
jgi:hypothetical protein